MLIGLMKRPYRTTDAIRFPIPKHVLKYVGSEADIKIKMEDGKEKTASGEVKRDGTVVIENFEID